MKIEDNLKKIIKHDKDIENLGSQLDNNTNEINNNTKRNISILDNYIQYSQFLIEPLKLTTSLDKPIFSDSTSKTLTGIQYDAYDLSKNKVNEIFTFLQNNKIVQYSQYWPTETMVTSTAMTGQNLRPYIDVEFEYNGDEFEFITSSYNDDTLYFDEGRGYELAYFDYIPKTISGEAYLFNKVTFKEAKKRRFKITLQERFGGIVAKDPYVVSKVITNREIMAFIGDSITEGAMGKFNGISYPQLVANALGMNCINNGIGATGYIANAQGTRTDFITRVQNDVLDLNPKYTVSAGGINDWDQGYTNIKNAVDLFIKKVKPNTNLIILSPFSPRNSFEGLNEANRAIREASLENGVPFIDMIEGETYLNDGKIITQGLGAWINGTDIATKDGNCWMYVSSDTTHFNTYGYSYIAKLLSVEIFKILNSNMLT